jgi:hypothetical protein
VTWTAVTQPGFGNSHDIAAPAILDFVVFNTRLYASTGRGNAAQIWRTLNGTTWAPMSVVGIALASGGLLSPVAGALSQEIIDVFAVFNALRAAIRPKELTDFGPVSGAALLPATAFTR